LPKYDAKLEIRQYDNDGDIYTVFAQFEFCNSISDLIETSGFFHENLKLFMNKKIISKIK